MWHALVGDESAFFQTLIIVDEQLAAAVRQRGCPCGGRLDRADYPRKPRGLPAVWEDAFSTRISFCCAREGCRRRSTPPSVRFFGRRVYVAAVILVVCGLWASARCAAVPKNTARRWRRFFEGDFLSSRFWQSGRARLVPPADEGLVIASLLARVRGSAAEALRGVLRFISPMTTESAPEMMVMT